MRNGEFDVDGILKIFETQDVPDDLIFINGKLGESENYVDIEVPAHNPFISKVKLNALDDGSVSELNQPIIQKLLESGRSLAIYGQASSGIINSLMSVISGNHECIYLKMYVDEEIILNKVIDMKSPIIIVNAHNIIDPDKILTELKDRQVILVSEYRIGQSRIQSFHHGFDLGSNHLNKIDPNMFIQVTFGDTPASIRQEFIDFYMRKMTNSVSQYTPYRDALLYGEKLGLIGHYKVDGDYKDFCIHPQLNKGEDDLYYKIVELSKLCKLPAEINVEDGVIKFIDGVTEKERTIELYEEETVEEFIQYIKKFRR